MHPTTARYLVESRQRDLHAEAARERLVREVRGSTRAHARTSTGVVTAVRAVFTSLHAAV